MVKSNITETEEQLGKLHRGKLHIITTKQITQTVLLPVAIAATFSYGLIFLISNSPVGNHDMPFVYDNVPVYQYKNITDTLEGTKVEYVKQDGYRENFTVTRNLKDEGEIEKIVLSTLSDEDIEKLISNPSSISVFVTNPSNIVGYDSHDKNKEEWGVSQIVIERKSIVDKILEYRKQTREEEQRDLGPMLFGFSIVLAGAFFLTNVYVDDKYKKMREKENERFKEEKRKVYAKTNGYPHKK